MDSKIHDIFYSKLVELEDDKASRPIVVRYFRDGPASAIRVPSDEISKRIFLAPASSYSAMNDNETFVRGAYDEEVIRKWLDRDGSAERSKSFRGALFEYNGRNKNSFMLLPIIPTEGDTVQRRIDMAKHAIRFLRFLGLQQIRLCALTSARISSRLQKNRIIGKYSREAEILVHSITADEAFYDEKIEIIDHFCDPRNPDYPFEIEEIVQNCDLIIPFSGATGSVLARCFNWLCGEIKLLALPWFKNLQEVSPCGEYGFQKELNNIQRHIKAAAVWQYLNKSSR